MRNPWNRDEFDLGQEMEHSRETVLFATTRFPPEGGTGVETMATGLVETMASAGVRVVVVTTGAAAAVTTTPSGVVVMRFPASFRDRRYWMISGLLKFVHGRRIAHGGVRPQAIICTSAQYVAERELCKIYNTVKAIYDNVINPQHSYLQVEAILHKKYGKGGDQGWITQVLGSIPKSIQIHGFIGTPMQDNCAPTFATAMQDLDEPGMDGRAQVRVVPLLGNARVFEY